MAIRQLTKKFESFTIREFNRSTKNTSILHFIFLPEINGTELEVKAEKKKLSSIVTKGGLDVSKLSETSITDIVNYIFGLFSEDKLIELIRLGNYSCSDEEASKILDNYIADGSDNSPITAFITLISELERDRHYLSTFGINFDLVSEMLLKTIKDSVSGIDIENLFTGTKEKVDTDINYSVLVGDNGVAKEVTVNNEDIKDI